MHTSKVASKLTLLSLNKSLTSLLCGHLKSAFLLVWFQPDPKVERQVLSHFPWCQSQLIPDGEKELGYIFMIQTTPDNYYLPEICYSLRYLPHLFQSTIKAEKPTEIRFRLQCRRRN